MQPTYNIIFRDNGVITDRLSAASKSSAIKKALRLSGLPTFGPFATLLEAGEQIEIGDCETVEVSRN